MAAITNATNSTSITEIINSEFIQRVILETHEEPNLYRVLGYVVDASGVMSATYAFPIENQLTLSQSEASGHTETDEIPVAEWTTTEVTVTAATVGIREVVSDDSRQDAIMDHVARIIRQNAIRLNDQADTDLLSNITSASNASNFSGTALDVTKMGTAIATWRALKPTGGPGAIVLDYAQVDDLTASMRSSSAAIYASAMGDRAADGLFDGQRVGLVMPNYEGFALYQTGNLPAFDGSNTSGAIMSTGMGGALGMAVWRGVTHEAEREAPRLANHLVSNCRYGTGLVEDSNLVEVISLAS